MATDPRPETVPLASAPEPAGPDGDAKDPTAEVVAGAFIDDVVVEKQNDALDALLARDRELAAAAAAGTKLPEPTASEAVAAPAVLPEPKATRTQEWTAALVIMVIIAAVCFALVSFFRG